jgi:hypothetical protein
VTYSSSSEDCPVGLEQLLSKGSSKESAIRRKIVIQTVLIEQHRQRTIGYYDPDKCNSNTFHNVGFFFKCTETW